MTNCALCQKCKCALFLRLARWAQVIRPFISPSIWDHHDMIIRTITIWSSGWSRYDQRWANSVLMTEYEYEYYSTFQKWPNTNTNIIRFEKGDRIRIRILFALKKATEYEYEYYSVWKNRPNTNTNIIRFENIDRIRIRILFGLKKSPEYEYEY